MFLPADYHWLEPVLFFAVVVFVIGLVGNMLAFGNRFVNALVTAILVAIVGGALIFNFGGPPPKTIAFGEAVAWLEPALIAAAVVFVLDLIGNMLSFESRVGNALATAVVFAIVFGVLSFVAYKDGSIPAVAPQPTASEPATPAPATPAPAAPAPATP